MGKENMKNTSKTNQFKTSHIILVILVIILIIPALLSLPAFTSWLDFSNSGEIGSFIGGVTAPFINGLAALLVFLAFKAQIKANEQLEATNAIQNEANQSLKDQEQARNITKQLSYLQDFNDEFLEVVSEMQKYELYYKVDTQKDSYAYKESRIQLKKMMYFIAEIDLTISEIEKYQGDKSFLYKKLFYLFEIKFAPVFKELQMKISIHEELSKDFDEELLIGFSYIKKFKGYFSNSNKYD